MKRLPEDLVILVEGAIKGQASSVAHALQSFSQSLSPDLFLKTIEDVFAHNMRIIAKKSFEIAQEQQPPNPPFETVDWSGHNLVGFEMGKN